MRKILSTAFIVQIVLSVICIIFNDYILANTDIPVLVGIGALVLAGQSILIAIIFSIPIIYRKWKKK